MKLKYVAKDFAEKSYDNPDLFEGYSSYSFDDLEKNCISIGYIKGAKFSFDFLIKQIDNEIKKLETFQVLGERKIAMIKMKELMTNSFKEISDE